MSRLVFGGIEFGFLALKGKAAVLETQFTQ